MLAVARRLRGRRRGRPRLSCPREGPFHSRAIGARPSRSGAASRRPFDSARPHISLPRGRGHPRNIWRPSHRGAALARKHPSLTVASRNILRRGGRAHGTGYAWPCRIRTGVAPVRAPRSPRPLADRYLYGVSNSLARSIPSCPWPPSDRGCPPGEGRSRRGPERGDDVRAATVLTTAGCVSPRRGARRARSPLPARRACRTRGGRAARAPARRCRRRRPRPRAPERRSRAADLGGRAG